MEKVIENGIGFYVAQENHYLTEATLTDESARSFGRKVQIIPDLTGYWRDATEEEKVQWEAIYIEKE